MPMPGEAEESDWQRYKMDAYGWRIAVFAGEKDRLHTAGWELNDRDEFKQALNDLDTQGVDYSELNAAECEQRNIRRGVRLRDPSGQVVELFHNMILDYLPLHSPVHVREFETGDNGDMGLGHYVLPTALFEQCYQFYQDVLGFRNSDYMHLQLSGQAGDPGQGLHFLHVDNPRHHSLALFEDPNPSASGCVHLMFEVLDMDELGLFMDRCQANDVAVVSTLGKHCNDQMVSVYVQSPGGFAIEFGFGGLQLDWKTFKPTETARPSLWGHHWQPAN